MLTVPARIRTGPASLLILVVLLALWEVLPLSDLSLFAAAFGYALAAVGVDIATGYAGQPNFGQAAFMAIGCYASALFQDHAGFGFIPALLAAIVVCAVIATILGVAAVRLEHIGFGIVAFTFAFVVAAFAAGDTLSSITGGPNGLELPDSNILGSPLSESTTLYLVALAVLAIGVFLSHNYVRSRAGRATMTVKQDERVAAVLGIGAAGVKLRAFALSAALGGAGGVMVGQGAGFITPESFPPATSVMVFGMAAFGGIGTIAGPILGALVFWLAPGYVPGLEDYQTVVVGVLFLGALILFPTGVYGSLADGVVALRGRLGRRAGSEPAPIASGGDGPPGAPPGLGDGQDEPPRESEGTEVGFGHGRATPAAGGATALAVRPSSVVTAEQERADVGDAILVASGVRVEFGGVVAVRDGEISVAAGTCHGVVGPNGAGKTTFLNALSGIARIQAGEIRLGTERIDGLGPQGRRKHGLGRTFQNPSLVGDLNAVDNVKVGVYPIERWSAWLDLIGLGLARRGERRTAAAAIEALDAVGFPAERRDVRAADLSHGEQKVIDLARALVARPRVLLLDEPTAGLTAAEMAHFATVLDRQRREFGMTIVVVSHHMRFLAGLADRVTVMESGSVLADGTFGDVAARPEVVSAFLGENDATF